MFYAVKPQSSALRARLFARKKSSPSFLLAVLIALAFGLGLGGLQPAQAERIKIVSYDLGGDVSERLQEVAKLRRLGTKVRIEGFCASACTLYLGLPQTCVSPAAVLGFHGPSTRYPGIPLPYDEFERISRQMAALYPGPISRWFMKTGRLQTVGLQSFSSETLVRMGVPRCSM